MRPIRISKSRRFTIVGLDQFGEIPAGRVERVKELARRCGVKPGTRIELQKLPSSYTRFGDGGRLANRMRARIRLQQFNYNDLAHELRHVAQGQQFVYRRDWHAEYGAFSSPRAVLGSKAYINNPYEIDARECEALGDVVRDWSPDA